MLTRLMAVCLLLMIGTIVSAQIPPKKMKMGKVEPELVALTTYEQDTSAVAFVVGDFGRLSFTGGRDFFRTSFSRHVRIKILKKEGLDYADVLLRYVDQGSSSESISSIKGYVYNMVNGEVVKEKLDNDNVFREDVTETRKSVKISLPNVKVGSVIEYSYTKLSDFIYAPDDWVAQRTIPTLVSDFRFEIPEYLTYDVKNSRYFTINELKQTVSSQVFRFTDMEETVNQRITVRQWRHENIPAFKEEPFMTSPHEYMARLEMELSTTQNGMKQYSTNWKSVLTNLQKSPYCGGQLKKTAFMKEELEAIKSKTDVPLERAMLVYNLIQNRMTWDENYGRYVREGGTRKAYQKRKGNVVEINLMLVAALKEVGVTAVPLMGNVRAGGKVVQSNPALTQLQYVIAYVMDGENTYFLDATSKTHPFNVLPARALNYQGVIMSDNDRVNGTFISIAPTVKKEIVESLQVTVEPDLSLTGQYKGIHRGYEAIIKRNQYKSSDDEDEYLTKIEDSRSGMLIDNFEITGIDNINEDVVEKYSFEYDKGLRKVGDAYVIYPLKLLSKVKNPFKQETRRYPVEYAYQRETKLMVQLTIPEGFSIKEIPKPTAISLIDRQSGSLRYLVSPSQRLLTVLVTFKLNRLVYTPDEYPYLKQFIEDAISFQDSPIVLVQNQ
ncbi:DUF3857 domain-containing protein [Flammeovirga aprica]|uniref:DUF3857 and transglutaminase domain-containing protein n=1 Tax=Flammeovirga aprica JL-4 TaxID=694437 RepID=A0A7X9NZD6_9BACT|nr:DUF3857 domain-containing protein [Flammeovirga aprica]NME66470.1 DUF3857 and transglutaminase domain-containing protein [Flammeovirga aprica JL-4]